MIRRLLDNEFLRFLATGGIAAGVNWLSRIGYSLWLDYSAAIILAYLTGMLAAYILFRLFVFGQPTGNGYRSIAFYFLVNAVGFALTWGLSMLLAMHLLPALGWQWYPLAVAHGIGVTAPAISSYFGHKYLSFR